MTGTESLADLIGDVRTSIYPRLAPLANRWNDAMGLDVRYPAEHREFLARCHAAGQTRPTPLLLRYAADDYNALHQELYGGHVFPLHTAFLLASAPGGCDLSRRDVGVGIVAIARTDGVL